MERILQSIDGGEVSLRTQGAIAWRSPPTSSIQYHLGSRLLHLSTGVRRFGEAVAAEAADISLRDSYSYRGGELRVGHGMPRTLSQGDVAVSWELPSCSLYMYVAGGTEDEVIRVLDQFDLANSDGAVVVRPLNEDVVVTAPPSVCVEIDKIGLLTIQPMTADVMASLPQHQGASVWGGELFRIGDSREPQALRLINESAMVEMPTVGRYSLEDAVQVAARLSVVWS